MHATSVCIHKSWSKKAPGLHMDTHREISEVVQHQCFIFNGHGQNTACGPEPACGPSRKHPQRKITKPFAKTNKQKNIESVILPA